MDFLVFIPLFRRVVIIPPMANQQAATFEKQPMWAGGRSPFNVSYGKLMMWIFLLSDAFTFSSLLVQY